MTPIASRFTVALVMVSALAATAAQAAPQLENLGRGVVAIHQPDGRVAVSWRVLGTDPDDIAFNVYRKTDPLPGRSGPGGGFGRGDSTSGNTSGQSGGRGGAPGSAAGSDGARGGRGGFIPGAPVKLNAEPITGATFLVDETANLATKTSYFVRSVVNGVEAEPSAAFTLPAGAPPLPYLRVPLQLPEGAMPGDGSAADLDGDGEYDLVLKLEQRGRDNSQGGTTGATFLQGYKLFRARSAAALDDQSRKKHPRGCALHAVSSLRSRWRRAGGDRVQDRRRHG